jgi:CheY-like chemotaxis protein
MNSVCLGLSLIQEEMESALKTSGIEHGHARDWADLAMEIYQSAQRAVDVLSDLLNYDKIEQGKFKLELSVFSTRDVVERTSSEFNLEAKRRGLNCSVNVSPFQDCVLVGDKVRLTQVLRNLLSNALKFTPEGGDLTITVNEEIDSLSEGAAVETRLCCDTMVSVVPVGKARISVADSGAGMTKSQIDSLFMDGVQFNANELQAGKGSGIGLYIAKGIVDQHDGTLSCSSPGLGCGSVFVLELPLFKRIKNDRDGLLLSEHAEATSEYDGELSDEMNSSRKTCDKTPLRFLVVDDSSTNVKLLMRLLEREGHTCKGAGDGSEAIGIVKSGDYDFDVVLLDFEMPVMNGPSAAAMLRSMGYKFLIIGITGNMLVDDVQFFKDRGADAVLGKPVRVDQIEDIIARYGLRGSLLKV